jgi:hypothetical protein
MTHKISSLIAEGARLLESHPLMIDLVLGGRVPPITKPSGWSSPLSRPHEVFTGPNIGARGSKMKHIRAAARRAQKVVGVPKK